MEIYHTPTRIARDARTVDAPALDRTLYPTEMRLPAVRIDEPHSERGPPSLPGQPLRRTRSPRANRRTAARSLRDGARRGRLRRPAAASRPARAPGVPLRPVPRTGRGR